MKKITKKSIKHKRPSWDEYFIGMVNYVGSRATCRGRSGCVVVFDKRVVSAGYVGSPPGLPHCDDVGHDLHTVIGDDGVKSEHCLRTIHAEQNAIAQAARFGVKLDGATLYCTMTPCNVCAKLIISAGIKKVVVEKDYKKAKQTKNIFKKAKIELKILNKEIKKY